MPIKRRIGRVAKEYWPWPFKVQLNAWMLRRRTKKLTDCEDPFKALNGKMPIQLSMKKDADLASILDLLLLKKAPKMKR